MLMDIDTLAVLQRDRYNDFQRQAELVRLLRLQNKPSHLNRATAPVGWARTGGLAVLQQIMRTALQTHIRAVPPR